MKNVLKFKDYYIVDAFFYRAKIDAEEVKELEDVGRFYMVASPEQDHGTTTKKQVHRLVQQ